METLLFSAWVQLEWSLELMKTTILSFPTRVAIGEESIYVSCQLTALLVVIPLFHSVTGFCDVESILYSRFFTQQLQR